jgi:HEAT repeat protein
LFVSFRSVRTWHYLTLVLAILCASLVACAAYRHWRIKSLIEDLKGGEPSTAQAATISLRGMGEDAVRYLIPAVREMDSQSRAYAGEVLRGFPSAVPPLVETLKSDEDATTRAASAEVLGKIGPAAKDSVPALIAALKDDNETVRRQAKFALGEIKDPAAIEPLIKTFERDPLSDNTAPVALGKIGGKAIPFLVESLKSETGKIREFSASALGEIGPAAVGSEAVPSLLALLNEKEPEGLRAKAVWALGRIKDERAVKRLILMLENRVSPVDFVIEALGEIGPAARDALPLLERWSWDADERMHGYAIAARKKITPESASVIARDEQDYAALEDALSSVKLLPPRLEEIHAAADLNPDETLTEAEESPARLPLTFSWILTNRKPGLTLCSRLLIDKGKNPFDGHVGLNIFTGERTLLTVNLDRGEYEGSTFEYGVEVTACRDARANCNKPGSCVGRNFHSDTGKYTVED